MKEGSRFKTLPLLIFVAFIAFSVRLVEVGAGLTSLSGVALAENTAAETAQAEMDKAAQEAENGSGEGGSLIIDDDAQTDVVDTGPEIDWQAAGDEDLAYQAARQEIFEDLRKRREEIDKTEKALAAREALLRAAEQEIDRKYQELDQLRARIENLLDQQTKEEKERIQSLVKIYEGMKAKDAANIFNTLDLDVLVEVMTRMSERKLSPILAEMNPERARPVLQRMDGGREHHFRAEGVESELEPDHHAEIAAPALECPKEIGVFRLARADQPPVGGDHIRSQQDDHVITVQREEEEISEDQNSDVPAERPLEERYEVDDR